ncbi:MAG: carboxypeptidase-like regulatory domain-containing protein, partial [Ignavibacteriae bacterium]|nr:carboxypeptidase-like regulatory domain-containing protein [Ignavibacteriota bacterium]
ILDTTNQEPLFGANIILVGTSFGASSDINGDFRVINIPVGKYTLKASYISYNNTEISIEVTENKTVNVSIELESQVIELGQEVTISAQSSGQASAINQQLTSEAIVNVVSAEKMLEFPDANVAESVARLPGVSIIRDGGEGSGVVVRGLSPKFSKITVDGIDMASSGAASRGANLSGIAQENLGGIELYKSPTADMDGEAIGGTINLMTSKAPNRTTSIFRGFGFYNELEKSAGQYSLFGKYSQRFADNNFGIQASINLESRDRSVDDFNGSYILGATDVNGIAPLTISSSAVSDIIETRGRIGGNLILDYNVGNGFIMFSSFLSKTTRDVLERSRSLSIANVSGDLRIRETERALQSYVNTLRGEHQFLTLETDWSLSFSYSRNERPFDHWIRFNERIQLPNINDVPLNQNAVDYYNKVDVVSNSLIDETRFMKEDVQERNFTGQLNFKYHFSFSSDISGYIKFGGKHKHINRNRNYEEAQLWAYLYPEWNTLTALDFLDTEYKPENFLRGKADLGIILDAERNKSFYNQYSSSDQYINSIFYAYRSSVGTSAGIPNYKVKENVSAFYVMP